MDNKDSLNINKVEMKKDRGDNLKRVVKPELNLKPVNNVFKKDLEIIKDLVADRGDSVTKPKHNEGVKSKNLDKTVLINSRSPKQNEAISKTSDNSAPANLITCKDSVSKLINDEVITKNNKQSGIISKSSNKIVPRNSKQNEEINKKSYAPALITDSVSLSKPLKDNVITKKTKHSEDLIKFFDKTVPSNLKQNEVVSFGIKDKIFSQYGKHNTGKDINKDFVKTALLLPGAGKPIEAIIKNFEKSERVQIVRKNIVESEKPVNRLDIEEKRRIRDRYTFKLKAFDGYKSLEDKNDAKDSPVEDNTDISTKQNNEAGIKETTSEYTKSVNSKIVKVPDPAEKSRKRPIIRTIIAKNDATKVYKTVTFAEQKRKSNIPLQIKIPVLLINSNITNDPVTENNKLPIANNDETKKIRNTKNPKISLSNEDDMTTNIKKPKTSPNNDGNLLQSTKISALLQNINDPSKKNVKNPKTPQSNADKFSGNKTKMSTNNDKLIRNIKIPSDTVIRKRKIPADTCMRNTKKPGDVPSKNNKIPKLKNNAESLKRNRKMPKTSYSSESRSSVKTKISKKERKIRLKSQLSHFSFATGNGSPTTEVAKWAPNSINKHTQPYYEAWVDTTLAAISRSTKKDKEYYESEKLVKSFKNLLKQPRNESPDLMYENYLDERYTGKIKINNKK